MLAPDIDPVAVHFPAVELLGRIFHPAIHWYGVMYLIGFIAGWALGVYRAGRADSGWKREEVGDVLFYIALGVIAGGRLGHVLFYGLGHYLTHPLEIFSIWEGGMAFHGALVGVIIAMWWYGRRTGRGFFAVADFVAPLTPIGLGAGRIGNFINQELWGRVTDVPWAMVFRTDPQALPRHPSQLYELALEGIVLFVVLWIYSSRPRPTGAVSAVFLIGYGVFRFAVEFVRAPTDGYVGWLTAGQFLTLPMIAFGAWLLFSALRRRAPA